MAMSSKIPTIVGYIGVVHDAFDMTMIEQSPVIRSDISDAKRDALALCDHVAKNPEDYDGREVDWSYGDVAILWSDGVRELMFEVCFEPQT